MAPIKCCTFNCRGWNNNTLILLIYILCKSIGLTVILMVSEILAWILCLLVLVG